MPDNQSNFDTPFINAHTHTFNKHHVPDHLAKKVLPNPLYKWITTPVILSIITWIKNLNKEDYSYTGRTKKFRSVLKRKFWTQDLGFFYMIYVLGTWVVFGYYFLFLIEPIISDSWLFGWLCRGYKIWFKFMPFLGNLGSIILVISFILIFPHIGRSIRKYIWNRIEKEIGERKFSLYLRYLNLAKHADKSLSGGQARIFNNLKRQYPRNSKFIVLPMDMEYMGAGPVPVSFPDQMDEILRLKSNNKDICYPFIFVDPRRIAEHGKAFINFNTSDPDNIILEDCQLKTYLDGGCAGIKIYPALGYYVFDKHLLPLWLYCAQNDIPITTHCSIGPIFYRGKLTDINEKFYYHPILEEVYEKDSYSMDETNGKLRFHQLKNKWFQINFTHPLNYLCLLHEPLLIKVIKKYDDQGDLKSLYGLENGQLTRNLNNLKINLAHYGSAEMWDRFLSRDSYIYSNKIIQDPKKGLDLKKNIEQPGKLYAYWHYVDWFSIITTMMLQFKNVYADVSYTSHDLKYLSLLSEILDIPQVANKVLFGTDFYVVSNHKTEKQFWIDMQNNLGKTKWDAIARDNPTKFLTSKLKGSI